MSTPFPPSSAPGPAGHAAACVCGAPAGGDPAGARRFGPTHALIWLVVVLGLGCGLFVSGIAMDTVFMLVGGLSVIGALTLTVAGGGRRLWAVAVEAAVRSSTGK
jgi:hypothetical protein